MIDKDKIERTAMIADKGKIYICPRGEATPFNTTCVGTVSTDWQHLLAASPLMFTMLENVAKGMEGILTIAESQGMDRVAADVQEIIASVKIVQSVAIYGSNALTAVKPTAK